ncbi:MAG: hypothetical protein GX847_02610, partial [Clostridiales bacterium]|nr:hypothetical protein [Clostridiales bacterium]
GESGAVELARRVVAESVGKYCGDAARVYFDTVRTEGPNSYLVTFTYIAAGGRVYLGRDRHAAAVTVTDGTVSKMSLCFRSFSIAGEENGLLPEIQAAAATGGAFMLCYTDGGDGVFKPSWVIVSDDS